MANFTYNNKLIDGKIGLEKLMVKFLVSNFGNQPKTLSDSEFLTALQSANFLDSSDSAILILKKFNYNISNETLLEEIKKYLTKCTEKTISTFNKNVKASKINSASYYRESQAINDIIINTSAINSRALFDSFDYLVNYLTNAVLCGEIIYSAENNLIKKMKKNSLSLEPETVVIIDDYVKENLNLKSILNTTDTKELEKQLRNYNKINNGLKKR